jgi:hypothetical protein
LGTIGTAYIQLEITWTIDASLLSLPVRKQGWHFVVDDANMPLLKALPQIER